MFLSCSWPNSFFSIFQKNKTFGTVFTHSSDTKPNTFSRPFTSNGVFPLESRLFFRPQNPLDRLRELRGRLKDVTVRLTMGSRIGVVGRNGAGKSTWLGFGFRRWLGEGQKVNLRRGICLGNHFFLVWVMLSPYSKRLFPIFGRVFEASELAGR